MPRGKLVQTAHFCHQHKSESESEPDRDTDRKTDSRVATHQFTKRHTDKKRSRHIHRYIQTNKDTKHRQTGKKTQEEIFIHAGRQGR